MNKLIMWIGGFLIEKYGKATALSIMFVANKTLLFTLIISFITVLFNLLFTTYGTITTVIATAIGLANGSSLGGSECLQVITASFLDAIGFFNAFDIVGPTLFLVYFTYFNVVLLDFSLKIYRFIDKSVTDFALIIK